MSRMDDAAGNRAVSALFRVFGGSEPREVADGFERTKFPAMHNGERLILGWLVPVTVLAALSEWLVRWMGGTAAWILILPIGFILLNLLAYSIPGRKVSVQWRCWLLLLTAWGWWRKDEENYISWFAWLWLGIFALNALAFLILGFGATLRISGWPGALWRLGVFVGLHGIAFVDFGFWSWTWAVMVGLSISVLYCLAVLRPACQWLGPLTVFREGKEALVTIDDGPDPEETPRLLDLLDAQQRKAIFFVIGEKVEKYPELAREIIRRGHEIGNHTMTHPQGTFWCAGPWRTRREISGCQRAVEQATGVSPTRFRAPVGHRNLFTHPFAKQQGLEVMGWSRRGYDAISQNPEAVLQKILPVRKGDIVLMHEGTGIAVEVLEGILVAAAMKDRTPIDPAVVHG